MSTLTDTWGREITVEDVPAVLGHTRTVVPARKTYRLAGMELTFPADVPEDAVLTSINAHAPEGYVRPAQPTPAPVPSPADTITRDQLDAGLAALGLSAQQSAALFATFAGIGK